MKRLIIFFFLIFLCTIGHAEQWTKEESITDFSKLLSSHVNPYLIPAGVALEARNLRANKTFGELTKRNAMDTYGACGSFKVTGLHRYYQTDGDQFTICSGSTVLRTDNNNDKAFVTIRDELTDGARWSFATFKNMTIAVNGNDANQKYDGHTLTTANTDAARTVSILTADLGAPFAELDTGTDLDASSWYQYRMAHYDGTTYSFSTNRSNPILTGAAVYNIALTDIPLGPTGTTTRYIYRTNGNASRAAVEADNTLNLVGTISDNSTTTFADTTADGSSDTPIWSTVAAGTSVTSPIGKFVLIHKERIFLGNRPSFTSDIYWSYPFRKDIFDTGSRFQPIREDDGDEITCLMNQSGIVVICKTNTIMKFITLSDDHTQWQVLGPYSHVGCQAPYSVDNTPKGIAYVAKDGIWIFDGSTSQLISDVVTPDLSDMLWTSRGDIAGIYFKNEYQVAYTSVEAGASVNDRVLVFDMQRDAYVIDDKSINTFTVFDSGTDEGTLYSGTSGSDGAILAHTETVGILIYKTQTDFESGTYTDTDVFGSEQDPILRIAWNKAFDDGSFAGKGFDHGDFATSTFARPDLDGIWESPVAEINATGLDKIFWNEELGSAGDITFSVRLAATSGAVSGESYSGEVSDPSGSDISGVSANNFIQIRASLTTTDITLSPELIRRNNFSIKMVYNKEGSAAETSIPTVWQSGFMPLGNADIQKMLWSLPIYYNGTSGILNFNIKDAEGDVNTSFTIDLSVNPSDDPDDEYTGVLNGKKFTHYFPADGEIPIANYFMYTITESGIVPWAIQRIATRFNETPKI